MSDHKHECMQPKLCHLHPIHVCGECGARTDYEGKWIEMGQVRYSQDRLRELLTPHNIVRYDIQDVAYLVEELMTDGQHWKANVVRMLALRGGYTSFSL